MGSFYRSWPSYWNVAICGVHSIPRHFQDTPMDLLHTYIITPYVLICIYIVCIYIYNHPEVDRIWGLFKNILILVGIYWNFHILSIQGWLYVYIYIYSTYTTYTPAGMNIQKSKPMLVFLKGTLQQVQQRWLRLSRRSGDPKFPSRNQHKVLMLWKKAYNGISMTISNCGITVVSIHVECRIHQVLYTSIVYTCLYMIYLNNAHSPEFLNQQGHTVK